MTGIEAHDRRKHAQRRFFQAWGWAIVPNLLDSMGVNFPQVWWWYVIRYSLTAVFAIALVVWLCSCWREWRARRAASPAK